MSYYFHKMSYLSKHSVSKFEVTNSGINCRDSLLEIVLQSVCLIYEALFNTFGLIRSEQKCASMCCRFKQREMQFTYAV